MWPEFAEGSCWKILPCPVQDTLRTRVARNEMLLLLPQPWRIFFAHAIMMIFYLTVFVFIYFFLCSLGGWATKNNEAMSFASFRAT